jgi:hypothetical protein
LVHLEEGHLFLGQGHPFLDLEPLGLVLLLVGASAFQALVAHLFLASVVHLCLDLAIRGLELLLVGAWAFRRA